MMRVGDKGAGAAMRFVRRLTSPLLIAVVIAIVAAGAAFTGWRAAMAADTAADLDQQATQLLMRRQQVVADVRGQVLQDLRLFTRYRIHVKRSVLIERAARRSRPRDPALAEALDLEARRAFELARALRANFFYIAPGYGNRNGEVAVDADRELDRALHLSPELADLRPRLTRSRVSVLRSKATDLAGATTLLVAALFFLTVAELTRRDVVRNIFAVSGLATVVAGAVLYLLVEARV